MSQTNRVPNSRSSDQANSLNLSPASSTDSDSGSSATTSPNMSPLRSPQMEDESDDREVELIRSSAPLPEISAGIRSRMRGEAYRAQTSQGVWQIDRPSLELLSRNLKEFEAEETAKWRRSIFDMVLNYMTMVLNMVNQLWTWSRQILAHLLYTIGALCIVFLVVYMMWPEVAYQLLPEIKRSLAHLMSYFDSTSSSLRTRGTVIHQMVVAANKTL